MILYINGEEVGRLNNGGQPIGQTNNTLIIGASPWGKDWPSAGIYDEVKLYNVALDAVGAHAGPGPFDEDLHRIDEVYLDAGGEFLVGELDGRIVAMGALRRHDDGTGEIGRMRVHPDLWRRGFGRQILTALERRARELDLRTLWLVTTTGQTAAQHLYEKNGYVPLERSESYGYEVIRYEKTLLAEAP
jgi:N-acetylglutamate synthase-like GNAT family acetyltransferase